MTAALAIFDSADFDKLDSDDLRERFRQIAGLTSQALAAMGAIIRVLEERGKDTDDLGDPAIIARLRLIGHGQCLPETFVRFGGTPRLMRLVQSLPIPEQKKLAEGGTVELVVYDEEGKTTKQKADPLLMTQAQIGQVFVNGRVRDEAEQKLILADERATRHRNRPTSVGKFVIDPDRGGVVCQYARGTFISKEDLADALRALR